MDEGERGPPISPLHSSLAPCLSRGLGTVNLEPKRRLELLERIRRRREAILARRGGKPIDGDAAELINQMRDERDEEIWRAVRDSVADS